MTAHREFHDGRSDGLIPLESLDLDKVTLLRRPPARHVDARPSAAARWARPST